MLVVHWFSRQKKIGLQFLAAIFFKLIMLALINVPFVPLMLLLLHKRNCIIYSVVSLALELESEFCFLFFPAEALLCCCCKVSWRQFYSKEFSLQRAAYFLNIHLFSLALSLWKEIFWKLLCLIYNDAKQIDIYWQLILGTTANGRMNFENIFFILFLIIRYFWLEWGFYWKKS